MQVETGSAIPAILAAILEAERRDPDGSESSRYYLRRRRSRPAAARAKPERRLAAVRVNGLGVEVAVPIASIQPLKQVFVKWQRPLFLKDQGGWRQAPAMAAPVEVGEAATIEVQSILAKTVAERGRPAM
jgi:hypothetical protein